MKKIFFFFLFSIKLFSQDIESIKASDTLYIYFDEKQNFPDLHLKKLDNGTVQTYLYTFPDAEYLKLATYTKDKEHRLKKKYFLKTIVPKIITIDTIHEHGLWNMVKVFNDRKKVIYLIDKNEKKCGKIYLRRAYCLTFPDAVE